MYIRYDGTLREDLDERVRRWDRSGMRYRPGHGFSIGSEQERVSRGVEDRDLRGSACEQVALEGGL